jgi:hypothetical protein
MIKLKLSRPLTFGLIGVALTWGGLTSFALWPGLGIVSVVSIISVLLGVDALVFALWKTRYAGRSSAPPVSVRREHA